ncbi:MAG: uroporphyrinogen-III synthase [Rudaea sp.]|uniref:uroporphyrinogen-III synthase n=1 Tax=Rudaea sp. TaxID=2136325 RepID=UPI0039E2E0CD
MSNRNRLSLAGAAVVVTRPAASAGALKRRIAARGGAPLGLPGVGIRAIEDAAAARGALRTARDADLAIFVSPNAVRHAFALLPALRFARATQVCAVGHATARALARHGVRNAIAPAQRQDSEGLLALPALADLRRRRVALIGAPGGRELLPAALRARGAMLQSIHVYRRAAPRWDRRHFAALENAAPPLLTLLSSADVLSRLERGLPPRLFARLVEGECVASSPRLAHAARAAGFARVHIAASAGTRDMIVAAEAALARHRL